MELVILSKSKIDAIENNLTEFLAEDIIMSMEDRKTLIIFDLSILPKVKEEYPDHKFQYIISVRKI